MAKILNSISFKNAVIHDGYIEEVNKDSVSYHRLDGLLEDWSNIPGLSITIKREDELLGEDNNDSDNE